LGRAGSREKRGRVQARFSRDRLQFRLAAPSKKHAFAGFVEFDNEMLRERWGLPPVSGPSFLAAIVEHSDNPCRAKSLHARERTDGGSSPAAFASEGRGMRGSRRAAFAASPTLDPNLRHHLPIGGLCRRAGPSKRASFTQAIGEDKSSSCRPSGVMSSS
jgi:hypothetical protein